MTRRVYFTKLSLLFANVTDTAGTSVGRCLHLSRLV